jgi:hypothetical protein
MFSHKKRSPVILMMQKVALPKFKHSIRFFRGKLNFRPTPQSAHTQRSTSFLWMPHFKMLQCEQIGEISSFAKQFIPN